MQKFVELLEQLDFSVSNPDNYENIEIRDLTTNEILPKETEDYSYYFKGHNGRSINLSENAVIIKVNENLEIREIINEEDISFYIDSDLPNDYPKELVITSNISNDFSKVGYLEVSLYHEAKTRILTISQEATKANLGVLGHKEFSRDIDISECSKEMYLQNIVNFLNYTKEFPKDLNLQTGLKAVMPSLSSNIDKMFNRFYSNIDKYISYYEELKEQSNDETEITKINQELNILTNLDKSNLKK